MFTKHYQHSGLPWWFSGKESVCQYRRCGSDPWVRKIPWRRKWQLTLLFLPGKSHGEKSLVGYSPWGHKGLDTTEYWAHTHKWRFMTSPLWSQCNSIMFKNTFLLAAFYIHTYIYIYSIIIICLFFQYWELSVISFKTIIVSFLISGLQVFLLSFSRSVMSTSLWPYGLQHASLSFTISWSLLKFMSIESVMPSKHLISCLPLLLLPSIFPSILNI